MKLKGKNGLVTVQDWLDDVDPDGVPRWGNRDLYLAALDRGVADLGAVASAIALAEEACRLAERYPSVPFDHIAAAILDGVFPQNQRHWMVHRHWVHLRLWWRVRIDARRGWWRD